MKYITFDNITVKGITYQRIIDFQMEQKIGEHTAAVLVVEREQNHAGTGSLLDSTVRVFCEVEGGTICIFCGIVCRSVYAAEEDYSAVRLELMSMSKLLDSEPVTATYQQTTCSYQQLMEQVVEGKAEIYFGVTDKAIGSWRYRNQETAWVFIKRLASQCNACVITNTSTAIPTISIGATGKSLTEKLVLLETYNENGRLVYRTNLVLELGTKLSNNQYVVYAKTYFKNAMLVTDYIAGTLESLKQETYYNEQSECKMLTGIVAAVEKEKVKVYFDTIDSSFDNISDTWFEYATPYATNGGEFGSGFYCMPEEGDRVRVFLPSADEGEAFVFGTVSESQMTNPEHAEWKMPGEQQILFTDKGIKISCKGGSVYIDMKSEHGINVWSDTEINLQNAKTVEIEGKKGVILYADNNITFNSSEAKMIMENDKIIFDSVYFQMN